MKTPCNGKWSWATHTCLWVTTAYLNWFWSRWAFLLGSCQASLTEHLSCRAQWWIQIQPPSLDLASDSPPAFVNMSRRAELAHMIKGVILTIPTSFVCVLSKPVATYALATPPPRRQKKASGLTSLPRRSTWLTKKAFHRAPAVVAAQNLLMKKLGLSNEGQLEAIDFERYLSMFNDGLSERQT
jgi:hypothetical protein